MEAIVLAGGLGTRLRGVVSDLPKPMAPIGDKPFLEFILRYLKKNCIHRVILSVGYKWESIRDFFGDDYNGLELIYCKEDEPLGTGGAISKAIAHVNSDNVYIINGDTYFDVPLNRLKNEIKNGTKLILSLKIMRNFDRYGCVETDVNGYVERFTEKSYRDIGDINGGIYLASKNIFDGYTLEEKFSFEYFIKKNCNELNVKALVFDGYFIDIGVPDDYARAKNDLRRHL